MASTNDKRVRPESPEAKRPKNWFIYIGTVILLIITVVAFVFLPASGSVAEGGELNFGSWNGKPISFVQGGYFAEQVRQVKAAYEAQGYRDSGDQFFAYQVWRRAFENTAIHLALLDKAQAAGIRVSDAYIDKQMIANPAFQEGGAFSKRKYRETSNAVKLSLRADIRDGYLKNRYASDATSVLASKAETEFLRSMAKERRVVEYVALPFSSYPEAERAAFAKANPALFKQARLSRVTMSSSRKEAEQVLGKVKSGALSFEEAAKNHSKDAYASKGGDMGKRSVWELKGELKNEADLDAALALSPGGLSSVYETMAGSWVFFRLDEAAAESDPASPEAIKSVTDYMNRNEKGRIEDWALAKAAEFAKKAKPDFASAALASGLSVKTTKPFPLNYGKALDVGYFSLIGSLDTTDLVELRGADTNERFLSTVFSLKAGEVSEPFALNDYAIVARVKEIESADDGSTALLAMYYPSLAQQNASIELQDALLADPALKDDFVAAFSRAYAQTD